MWREVCGPGAVKSMLAVSWSTAVVVLLVCLCFLLFLATADCYLIIIIQIPLLPDYFYSFIKIFCTPVKHKVNLYFYVF
jgi:hypothetical protein